MYRSGQRLGIDASPVHLSRLEFHHAIRPVYRTEEVIRHCNPKRIPYTVSSSTDAFIVAVHHIAGVAHEIKRLASADDSPVVIRNVIGRHPLVLRIFLNQSALLVQEITGHFCRITLVIEYLMRVHKHLLHLRERDFIERRIHFAPERGAPCFVQLRDVAVVLLFQEQAESFFGFRIIIELHIRLIIQLPPDDARIVPVMACQCLYHARCQLPVKR